MTPTDTWWETIFEGNLSLGLNKERISDLTNETFLYFDDEFEMTQETNQTHLQ
ncbi:hypothetical protein [Sporosarcina sp. UB5]|uniref:hypothetical protein n=1 Tax=Sporosarcina sp. UB5 TaxID=3047463 RepID=UPI003D7A31A3